MKLKIYKIITIILSIVLLIYTSLFVYSIARAYDIRNKSSVINDVKIEKSIISDRVPKTNYFFKCESNSITLPSEICQNFREKYPKLCNQPNLSSVYNQYNICDSNNYRNEVPFGNVSCSEHIFHLLQTKFDSSFFIPYDEFIYETKSIVFLNILLDFHQDTSIDLLRLENKQLEVFSKTNISIITKNGSFLHLVLPSEVIKNLISIIPYSEFTDCETIKSIPN
ncbi:hypothetical protein [Leptospira levettii]|uniref:hypothetical protein n=1 Tax=Leptospira levettii TaxID=2023178 RepID=UPI000C2B43EC|nr:hypothetical protein [Leptospira levettii]